MGPETRWPSEHRLISSRTLNRKESVEIGGVRRAL